MQRLLIIMMMPKLKLRLDNYLNWSQDIAIDGALKTIDELTCTFIVQVLSTLYVSTLLATYTCTLLCT